MCLLFSLTFCLLLSLSIWNYSGQALSSVQLDVVILVDSEGEVMFECLVDKMRAFMDETGWLVFCVIDHLIKSNLLLLYVYFVGFTV